ncbi:MAG: hypothetical protein EWV81_01115 [Microcystis aeruginosa Ma_SC_T_19800800_S464]|uniref:Uncharacterized protein n=1 Tax=Microcystis aeruginosa Ma_SC_T_19800800_S464 TaxID=2486257 RepID=A0A552E667_MICAE|nr:MAG: hypothetical protein EWV81_01115 [Microcystis aeruginosa Ma_SC_T_19800800_S464]
MTHIMTDIRTVDKSARVAFPPRVETTGLPSSRLFSCDGRNALATRDRCNRSTHHSPSRNPIFPTAMN